MIVARAKKRVEQNARIIGELRIKGNLRFFSVLRKMKRFVRSLQFSSEFLL